MLRFQRWILAAMAVSLLLLVLPSGRAQAQWPPFEFELMSRFAGGRITYDILFILDTSKISGPITNLSFKIPVPEGTRFVEASAQPSTAVTFDGIDVTFFTSSLANLKVSRNSREVVIQDAWFTVEVTDPNQTVFSTRALITWEGYPSGSHLTPDFNLNTTRQPLNWEPPASSHLELEIAATAINDEVTYEVYPRSVSPWRMWDLRVTVPLPEGATFISAAAPEGFATDFNGQEVSFFVTELVRYHRISPLLVKVSTTDALAPVVATHAWATWKNVGREVGTRVPVQEEVRSGDILVQPHTTQRVTADMMGDVPFSNYDVTSVALQEEGPYLKLSFYTAGELGPVDRNLEYVLYIDSDCNQATGNSGYNLGSEYRVRYRHERSETSADIRTWSIEQDDWERVAFLPNVVGGDSIGIWIPLELLQQSRHFCWVARIRNTTGGFHPPPPDDLIYPIHLQPFESAGTNAVSETAVQFYNPATGEIQRPAAEGTFVKRGSTWSYWPAWSAPPPEWTSAGFDAGSWFTGSAPLGYGQGKFATDIAQSLPLAAAPNSQMLVQRTITETGVVLAVLPSGQTDTVLMRQEFLVEDPAALTELSLEVTYQGGFAAYLNGVEVARRGLGEPESPLSIDTTAETAGDRVSETIDLSGWLGALWPGNNVLSLEVHRAAASADLFIEPALKWANKPAAGPVAQAPPAPEETGAPAVPAGGGITGKLAVPLDNGFAQYDVYVFTLPGGQELTKISNARQPNFSFDGQRLLVNREGGGRENLYEITLVNGSERQVSDAPRDEHPFYDVGSNRVVYANAELTLGSDGRRHPFIFVQCSLLPPHQEVEAGCRDIVRAGILVPAGPTGEIIGSHPVWTVDDRVVYRGCDSWLKSASCGIYAVTSTSTKRASDGYIPQRLTEDTSDTPTDTKGDLIAFMSARDGNWEVYVMNLNGDAVRNLSQSPASSDGLATISPDGRWVAFVSDRGGRWAVWAVPAAGGEAQKLLDLPERPWGEGDRDWTNERLSWGP